MPGFPLLLKPFGGEAENFVRSVMSIDFTELTQAVVSGAPDVHSCLIVSLREGLVLGAFPPTEEDRALDVWTRITALGEINRGFIAVRDELWVFCRRGPYAALATALVTARPGVVLDRLEQMLLAAEESRVRREAVRSTPDREQVATETPRGPRTALHREAKPAEPGSPVPAAAPAREGESAISAWARKFGTSGKSQTEASVGAGAGSVVEIPEARPSGRGESAPPEAPHPETEEGASPAAGWASFPDPIPDDPAPTEDPVQRDDEGTDGIDRFELTREFRGLLSKSEDGEE